MGGWQTVRLANPIFSAVSNSSSNGGDASRVGKRCSFYLVEFVSPLLYPARRSCWKMPRRETRLLIK